MRGIENRTKIVRGHAVSEDVESLAYPVWRDFVNFFETLATTKTKNVPAEIRDTPWSKVSIRWPHFYFSLQVHKDSPKYNSLFGVPLIFQFTEALYSDPIASPLATAQGIIKSKSTYYIVILLFSDATNNTKY